MQKACEFGKALNEREEEEEEWESEKMSKKKRIKATQCDTINK